MRAALGIVVAAIVLAGCGEQTAAGGPDAPVTSGPASPGAATRGTVEGTVRGGDGQGVGGVLVVPKSLDTPGRAVPEIAVTTDPAGRYRWTLEPGRYEIAVRVGGRGGWLSRIVSVEAGRTATADFR